MRYFSLITYFLLLVSQLKICADSPAPEVPWVTTSSFRNFIFKMIPGTYHFEGNKLIVDKEAQGVAYKINDDGDFEEIWRTNGWYTFKAMISDDGRYLVRFGPWASDYSGKTDLAVAFYDRGQLIKKYQVKDLIKNSKRLESSVSHYMWRPEIQTIPNGFNGDKFHLVLIDKTSYEFDFKTGKIIKTGIDKGAKGRMEIFMEDEILAVEKGEALFKHWNFKDSYKEKFLVTNMSAGEGKMGGVYFNGPEWHVDLKPLKKFAHDCSVSAVFPIHKNEISAVIRSKEIEGAFESAFNHPFIKNRFSKDDGAATGIRLRITGDRLHWNTKELEKYLKALNGKSEEASEGKSLRHWAYFIIDAKNPRFTSFYYNTKTDEIVYEGYTEPDYEVSLLDATGKLINRKPLK